VTLPAVLKRETIEQLAGLPRLPLPSARRQFGLEGSRLPVALTVLAESTSTLQSVAEEGEQQRAVL